MSDSALVDYTRISPNTKARISQEVVRVTIHHAACVCSVEALGAVFALESRQASATYGIGNDGRVGQYSPESRRPQTSSNWRNDDLAITIEVSNSEKYGDWPIGDAAMETLINLLVDICQRHPSIGRLNYTGDTTGNITLHKMFVPTGCPGTYLESKIPYIEEEVNRRLDEAEKAAQPPTEERSEPEVKRFNTLEEIPDYGKETIGTLMEASVLNGDGEGNLNLSEDMIRILVIVVRLLVRILKWLGKL